MVVPFSVSAVTLPTIVASSPLNLPPLKNGEIIVFVPLIIGAESERLTLRFSALTVFAVKVPEIIPVSPLKIPPLNTAAST